MAALTAVREASAALAAAQRQLHAQVHAARQAGTTWRQLAMPLRVSRQSAAERFGAHH